MLHFQDREAALESISRLYLLAVEMNRGLSTSQPHPLRDNLVRIVRSSVSETTSSPEASLEKRFGIPEVVGGGYMLSPGFVLTLEGTAAKLTDARGFDRESTGGMRYSVLDANEEKYALDHLGRSSALGLALMHYIIDERPQENERKLQKHKFNYAHLTESHGDITVLGYEGAQDLDGKIASPYLRTHRGETSLKPATDKPNRIFVLADEKPEFDIGIFLYGGVFVGLMTSVAKPKDSDKWLLGGPSTSTLSQIVSDLAYGLNRELHYNFNGIKYRSK